MGPAELTEVVGGKEWGVEWVGIVTSEAKIK